jgi:hypothetical protein
MRVNARQFGCFDERGENGPIFSAIIMTHEESVFARQASASADRSLPRRSAKYENEEDENKPTTTICHCATAQAHHLFNAPCRW